MTDDKTKLVLAQNNASAIKLQIDAKCTEVLAFSLSDNTEMLMAARDDAHSLLDAYMDAAHELGVGLRMKP